MLEVAIASIVAAVFFGVVVMYTQLSLELQMVREELDKIKKSPDEAGTSVERKDD